MSQTNIKERIADLMSVIPHCQTKAEALEVQDEILELEQELE
jgi:hypothetical protein